MLFVYLFQQYAITLVSDFITQFNATSSAWDSFYGSVWDSPNTPNIGWELCTLQSILTYVGATWYGIKSLLVMIFDLTYVKGFRVQFLSCPPGMFSNFSIPNNASQSPLLPQLWFTAYEGSDDQKERIWSKEARTTVVCALSCSPPGS